MKQDKTTALLNIRIDTDLKKAFDAACANQDQTASQVLRAAIRDYVKKHAQGSLLK